MEIIVLELKPDDKRLGRQRKDGYEWPEVDINERSYRRGNVVTLNVGTDRFVIIPPGQNHRYEVTVVEPESEPAKAEGSHKGTSAAPALAPTPAASLKKDKAGDGEDNK